MKIKMFKKLEDKKAFSLVESLVTVFIFLLISGGLYASMVAGESSWLVNKDKTELQQELRKAMEWMKYDMRQAGDISIDVDADGVWQEASISYFKPQGVSNGVIDWGTTNPGPVQFFLDGDTEDFCRLYDGNKKLIARNITHVQFRRLDTSSDILEVELTGQKTTIKGNVIDDSLDFKIKLRN